MKPSFSIFLIVAEEMSISRAAKRAFVTQQCVSDHIKRLEEEYCTTLFERKPRLRLTMAGESMLQTLRNVRILEKNMATNMKEIASGHKGNFTLGISTSRAQVILPRVLKRYYEAFPGVNISFCVDDTAVLEKLLLEGTIDLFVGVNTQPNPDFCVTPLALDEMVLIISSGLLKKHFGSKTIQQFESGADLSLFSDVPFTLYYKTGAINIVINQHLNDYNLRLKTIYNVSDCDTQIMLCASGLCASLCPKMLLALAHQHNSSCPTEETIHMFPIKNFDHRLRVDLISHQNVVQPFYINAFMEIVREEVELLSKSH